MISAEDMTYSEVRTQYVVPLLNELTEKSGISGVLSSDSAPPSVITGTLFDDIAASDRFERTLGVKNTAAVIGNSCRCYDEMIEEASALSLYMTPQELSLVTAITTSCFLSFLLQQCNSTKFLRSYYDPKLLPLDERLACALESYNNTPSAGLFPYSGTRAKSSIGEQDDLITSAAFYRFIQQGLGAFLASGRAFTESTDGKSKRDVSLLAGSDLLRFIAMAICPNRCSNEVSTQLQEEDMLSSSTFPYAFHLVYADRVRLVRLCVEDLVVPENIGDGDDGVAMQEDKKDTRSKFTLAIKELRCSLFDFASHHAQSDQDACLAYKALVSIIVREGSLSTVQVEFKRLMDVLLKSRSGEVANSLSESLSELITKYNGSRFYADGEFTRDALVLLGKSIHEKLADNRGGVAAAKAETSDDMEQQPKERKECKPYLFNALLKVTKSLIYFLLDIDTTKKMCGDAISQDTLNYAKIEGDAKLQIIRDASFLLLYPSEKSVVKSSAELLALAFAYDAKYLSDIANIKHLFMCTKKAIMNWDSKDQNDTPSIIDFLKGVIYTASRSSETYAFNLLSFCVNESSKLWHVASIVSSVQPRIAMRVLANINMGDAGMNSEGGIHQILTHLSSTIMQNGRQLQYSSIETCLTVGEVTNWSLYQLVRYSFVTSNFSIACEILEKHLVKHCSQQTNFLWLNSLLKLAEGEEMLRVGHLAIPSSLAHLSACHSIISSVASISCGTSKQNLFQFGCLGRFGFQLEFLTMRLEFLQLVKDARCTCSEYMLISNHFSGNTRTRLHLKNLPKCFTMLASRYIQFYRLYGLHICQQSRSTLRGLSSMCSFLGEVLDLVFFQKAQAEPVQDIPKPAVPLGDKNHPMGILLSQLRLRAAEAKRSNNPIEAEVLLDAIDVILKCPVPFPSSFFLIKPIAMIHSTIIETSGQKTIDLAPGVPLKLVINGIVPEAFIRSSKVSFSQILAWPSIRFEGQIVEDEELDESTDNKSSNEGEGSSRLESKLDAIASPMLPDSKFILPIELDPLIEEGYHRVGVQLGVRDVYCGEWLLPMQKELKVVIRVVER